MNKPQEIAARINEASVALIMPDHNGQRVGFWIAQAQQAMSEAEQSNMSIEAMERIQYAFAAFEVQAQGL